MVSRTAGGVRYGTPLKPWWKLGAAVACEHTQFHGPDGQPLTKVLHGDDVQGSGHFWPQERASMEGSACCVWHASACKSLTHGWRGSTSGVWMSKLSCTLWPAIPVSQLGSTDSS